MLEVSSSPADHPDEAGTSDYPGVTRILRCLSICDDIQVAEDILNRGSEVHLATKYYDLKDYDLRTTPQNRRGYVKAYVKFRKEHNFQPAMVETPVISKNWCFRGRLDRAGPILGVPAVPWAVLEIATGSIMPYKRYQLSGYGLALDPVQIFRRIAVELHEDATYRIEEYSIQEYLRDRSRFIACVQVAQLRKELGLF